MPNNYQFLLRLCKSSSILPEGERKQLLEQVNLTLTKMAYGGIYDQVGGGFARYSVDGYWKVPHFEKMLYDNAQLVTLYSEAFQATKNPLYKQVVYETLVFVERELTSPEGGFYSALDADSEGEEGKYYVWKREELQTILQDKFSLFADYFNINEHGFWEHDNYILLRHDDDEIVAERNNISVADLTLFISEAKAELLDVREKRIRPGLDNKILTSWNALMLKAYVDAYKAFNEQHFLEVAIRNVNFILTKGMKSNGGLKHIAGQNTQQIGFLEDYCFTIEALIALYQASFDEQYILKANELMQYCTIHFQDKQSGMFFFTSDEDKALITRKMELTDNVIPASNSSMAKSLFFLGHYLENESYIQNSRSMLNNMLSGIESYGTGYSNWAMLLLHFTQPFYEIAINGKLAVESYKAFQEHYLPNALFAVSSKQSAMPLLKNRFVENKTLIYVCENKTCLQPVSDVEEALKLMEKS